MKQYLKRYLDGPMVRPLALAGPIFVLLVALPLLRPLRHPDPGEMSNDERLRLATIRSLVQHRSLSLDRADASVPGAVSTSSGSYSSQPPMMALMLWAPAWLMDRCGITFKDNPILVNYLLTVLGVTLPVAGAAGLIYRMGRLFELRRPIRTALGIAVVTASGLLTYSVVLNPHAPAATLLLASAACLVHVVAMNRDDRRAGWFALAGACAALAATIDPAAFVLTVLFLFVIPAMRLTVGRRVAGVLLYILGATPVIALHGSFNIPITGDLLPASIHIAMSNQPVFTPVVSGRDDLFDEEDVSDRSAWNVTAGAIAWFANALVGEHGVFSHFPVIFFGILGISAVMHRHWPSSTKVLAGATGAGAIAIILLYRAARVDWSHAMFATKWFIVFTPLLLFWSGAWLRRAHSRTTWGLAGILLAFSMFAGIVGATDPQPRHGFDRYTLAGAMKRLTGSTETTSASVIAGRAP